VIDEMAADHDLHLVKINLDDRGHWRGLGAGTLLVGRRSGIVTIDTLESNLWGPGSGWRYVLVSAAEGTDLRVSLTRLPNRSRGS
jgi:hypothetical protein